MKKIIPFILLICMVLLVGCKSKNEKAEELIKKELSKTLVDFDSYQPIETTVNEAKMTIYNDTACWKMGARLAFVIQLIKEYSYDCKSAKESMAIWENGASYSSYSNIQYKEYEEKYEGARTSLIATGKICKKLVDALRDSVAKLDTTKIIGWEVSHYFRYKTENGSPIISNYRYIISKDFKSILFHENKDGTSDKLIREVLETIKLDFWDHNLDWFDDEE